MSERRGAISISGTPNAGFAMVGIMWTGTVPTPSTTTASQFHDFVLADVQGAAAEAQCKFRGFTEMQHPWYTPLKQVSAESSADGHAENDDNHGGKSSRWTSYSWQPPRTPPDQFMTRFWNAFLYVAHIINADNIRILLYGSRHRNHRRRYRRFNPNSGKNRRYRKMMRATADITRILRGSWDRARAVWSSNDGEKEEGERKASASGANEPPCYVGLSAWLQMAAPAAALPPAFPPAPLTLSEVLDALFPSSSPFLPEAAPVDDPCPPGLSMASLHRTSGEMMVIPELDAAATWLSLQRSFAATDLCRSGSIVPAAGGGWDGVVWTGVDRSSVASCPTERADIRWTVANVVELYSSAGHAQVLCIRARSYTTGEIATGSEIVRHRPMPLSCRLEGSRKAAVPSLALPAPAQRPRLCPSPSAAGLGVTIPSQALVASYPSGRPATSLHWSPDAVMTDTPDAATWSFHSQNLAVMDSRQSDSVMPEDGWNGTIRTGFSRWFTACPMARVDVRWTLVRTIELPRNIDCAQVLRVQERLHSSGKIATARLDQHDQQAPTSPSFCRSKLPVESSVILSSVPLPAAAPWPPLSPSPPAAPLGVAVPLETPVAPWPPVLSGTSLPEASDAAVTAALDAATWSILAKKFAVVDLCQSDSVMPEGGWGGAIETDVDRLSVARSTERVDVRWILAKAAELYPNTGYAQGSDYAAFAIYRGMGGDKAAALKVFVQWASPTTWFQSSTVNGEHAQVQMGMRHSWAVIQKHSPSVHAWLHSKTNASLMLSELTGDDAMMALYASIFMTGVCSLCTRLGLPAHIVHSIILKTLETGNSGPAVSLWVVHCLLGIAEAECNRTDDVNEDVCIQARLYTASETVTSFDDLRQHAPLPLTTFVKGYRAAMSSLPLPAAPFPPLCPFPPAAAALGASIPLEPPLAPWPPSALPVMIPLHGASEEATASSLDAATWLSLARSFEVTDLSQSDSVMPEGGWDSAIQTDVDRLSIANSTERVDVQRILQMAAELYPNTGYAQGADYAALAIYRGMGRGKEATLGVFVKWASPTTWFQSSTIDGQPVQLQKGMRHSWKVLQTRSPSVHAWLHSEANASLMLSELTGDDTLIALYASVFMTAVCSLCTRQGLPGHVVCEIIQRTLEAGNSGPAVSLWVVHCLLRMAEADCRRKKDVDADTCIQARLYTAGENVTSFDELDRHAPMTLSRFVQGYQAMVVSV